MTKTIEDLFFYLATGADILIVLLFLVFFKKTKDDKGITCIAVYCFLFLLINYLADFVLPNFVHFFYSLFTYVEYSAFSYFLWLNTKHPVFKRLISYISIIFLILLTFYYFTTPFRSLDSVPIGVETIIILVFCFYYLYEQMNDTSNLFIYNKYQFWVITGMMIYLAGSFFIYIFANQLDTKFLQKYWFLTLVFYVIKNIFFAIGFLLNTKPKNNSNAELKPYLN